jgi:hypothetical protein
MECCILEVASLPRHISPTNLNATNGSSHVLGDEIIHANLKQSWFARRIEDRSVAFNV